MWEYEAGFEFWVKAQFRRSGPALESQPDDQPLHVGVQFAGGKKVVNAGALPEPAGSAATGLILNPMSLGRRTSASGSYLPGVAAAAPRPLVFVCEWAAFDIPEGHAETDAQLILDAARHSVPLWPEGHG